MTDEKKIFAMPGTIAVSKQAVIEMLAEWIAKANDEELTSIALVGLNRHGDVFTQWNIGNGPFVLVGGLEMLKHKILHVQIEGSTQ